jgi:flagellar M-ring protein FliF
MSETVVRMWAQLREYLSMMPKKNKIQMVILAVVVITLAGVTVSLLTRTTWVNVPNTGDPNVASQVYSALGEMGIPRRFEGGFVQVPQERLGDVEMRLRERGILGTSGFVREIMPEATGFGITSEHARQLYNAERGEEIRQMLLQNPRISNALVIVNSGEVSPFRQQTNARRATASLMLTLAGGGRLTQSEAQAIGEVVRAAIPGIAYEDIGVVDSDYNHYRIGDASQDLEMEMDQRSALENRLRSDLKINVEQLLAPIFGLDNIRVQPHVKLNFDRAFTESIEFAPPIPGETEGIVRSSEEIYENTRRRADAEGIPGTDSNALGTAEYPYGTLDDLDEYRRAMISRNYEINQTVRSIEHERGAIEELALSVLINSGTEGVDQDYTVQLTDLVSKAIGVAPGNVSVQHIPFSYVDTSLIEQFERWEAEQAARRTQQIVEMVIMYAVILLLGVMFMLLVRTIFKSFKPAPEPEPVLLAAGPGGIDYVVDDEALEERYEDVDLTAKSAGLEQIERFIDKDPASVAQLLRNWLTDE